MTVPKKRGKFRPPLTDEPAPTGRAAALIEPGATPAAPAEPEKDWKADPDLRAFVCLLSYDAGWMTEPRDIVWSFNAETKLVEVKRPEGSQSTMASTSAVYDGRKLEAIKTVIYARYGIQVAWKVEDFARPGAEARNGSPLGPRARFLRELSARAYTAGGTQHLIEIAMVDLVRYCVDLARAANGGDQSPSAIATRAQAAGAILALINPAPA